ncbi:MAG: ribonuclease P protein subunit [Candidatus Aenigmarchaeota archaeon]|nr:ribonuclease P protein subunit [Candidatus Aenigmarchaeota archaeon]
MITEKNLINHELIGLKAEVAGKGFSGEVVLETKNMLGIKAVNGIKRFPKLGTSFVFTLPNGKRVSVSGKKISSRAEDRIKTKVKKWQ